MSTSRWSARRCHQGAASLGAAVPFQGGQAGHGRTIVYVSGDSFSINGQPTLKGSHYVSSPRKKAFFDLVADMTR